jgi:hypothetical protein
MPPVSPQSATPIKMGSSDAYDRSGLHRAHIGEIERGESNVTLQTLKIVADTLGCRIVDLVKGL